MGIENLKVFFFQTLKQQKGNDISSTWTSSDLVSRAQQVAQEVIDLIWKKRRSTPCCLLEQREFAFNGNTTAQGVLFLSQLFPYNLL